MKLKELVNVYFIIGGLVVFGISTLLLYGGNTQPVLLVPGILLFMGGILLLLYGLFYRPINWLIK